MKAILHVCIVAGVLATLSACSRLPSNELLKADLERLIDANFVPGLIEVASARHADIFPYVWSGEHVRVAFEATLRLRRDHRFGAWDQVNVGALALLLDAAPEDIHGVKVAGNAAGDVLAVGGHLGYLAAGGALKLDTAPPARERNVALDLVLIQDFKTAAKSRWRRFADDLRKSKTGLGLEEWQRARRAVAGRSARMDGGFSVATDREAAAARKLGRALERAAQERNLPFAALAAEGPQEALDFLRGGRVSAAIVRNTEAALAVAGAAPFDASGPYRLVALAALYPQPIHVIVKDDSPLGSPADLFGKHVGVAGTARVNAVEAEAILRGHGVALASLAEPLIGVPAAEALDQLEAGAFDALIMTTELPSAALRHFAGRRPVRLLPFDGDAIALLTGGAASYVATTVPARSYPGQARPLATVAAVAMLVSVDTVPAREAVGLIDLILSDVDYLRMGSLAGVMVSRSEAQRPMTLPWHPGAVESFSIGLKN